MEFNSNVPKETVIKKFKEIVSDSGITFEKVFLFGSRARGRYNEDSDWDFMVISKYKINDRKKRELNGKLRIKFHDYFPYNPIDIVIKDKETFDNEKNILNTVSNEAYTEGIES